MSHIVHPVILCGGSGTRLWPLSTPEIPKQFKALTSEKSMIEETADRFVTSSDPNLSFTTPLVVGSVKHRHLLEQSLPDARKILEPFGRNSAPAVAAACLASEPDDLILILPADHSIQDVPAFHLAIAAAAKAAEDGAIVTFGIEPTHPATGYGYIKAADPNSSKGPIDVEEFVEKPNQSLAETYLATGTYYWNAGIFMFKARCMLDALEAHAPDVLNGVRAALPVGNGHTQHLQPESFAATPNISIDYAVMEHAQNVKTVPVSMGWNDVGGFPALHGLLTNSGTESYTYGPVHVENSERLYVRSEGPTVAVSGVSSLAIVATADIVKIAPIEDARAVKSLNAAVQSSGAAIGLSQDIIKRLRNWLWTAFDVWAEKAWDADQGGFVEQLSLDGEPDLNADRRLRVHARQIFSFSEAVKLDWPGASKARWLVEKGIDYLDTTLRHPDGGWVHTVKRDGTPIDGRRDLYDHAFIVLAGATAYEALGSKKALKVANDAISFIDSELKDHEHGGWIEGVPATLPRRANPHMHLLEAMMAYHAATGCDAALARASEIVRLFETRFFNPATNVLAEHFSQDWRVGSLESETVFEPGHHYEWATLLLQYEQLTAHDTVSWRRRLIRKATAIGINSNTGFSINSLQADGTPLDSNSRLWHQLELFRAHLLHPTIAGPSESERQLRSILDKYLNAGPTGAWIDELGPDGSSIAQAAPASMLYHAVTTLTPVVKSKVANRETQS